MFYKFCFLPSKILNLKTNTTENACITLETSFFQQIKANIPSWVNWHFNNLCFLSKEEKEVATFTKNGLANHIIQKMYWRFAIFYSFDVE